MNVQGPFLLQPKGLSVGQGSFLMRPGRLEDCAALEILERRSQQAPWPRGVFESELETDCAHLWVLEAMTPTRPLAGYLAFWLIADEVQIINIAVDPTWRRMGLARLLLHELLEQAPPSACQSVSLEVRVSNFAAQRLYKSLGFLAIGERKGYYSDNGEDACVMVRSITRHASQC